MLCYRDVKIYDGSMEEWCRDEKAPLVESTGDK
jgi:3-mercaptopyruvate sulfurtransferase SseA